ncbi:MAG TPA: (2Fe-2S) ferredoxin domain-containing protein [Spirochaetales bacterium]|mgnify:FL=1|nr:(2Fe-2S) ferredoxin domain-containing protein [Spirochaetales bacterium]HPD79862.1 (2Fe-2S) ferredoxin domain-containing protein [Spirochaetales bacterium]HQG40663.1 (2Fe-2S) ferredoxin domain-containing protein [Spirochaetales bacterium]HQK33283.1 (2Fe-2S) ferredoxin domain-containing protein [Spirochaetales bacterium]HRV28635.1 (2Fe-2S) ferredoxin domain-containing protein [Spirochaetia bacterium]
MGKMTLEELRKLREAQKSEISKRDTAGKDITIFVGMGTCGIAAGAKTTFDTLIKAVDANGLSDKVVVKQTGCMGLCYVEPTVEVIAPGMPQTIYGKVDSATAEEIVKKHLVEHTLVEGHIYDRPAIDIVKK